MKWPVKFERRKFLQILNEQVVQKCTQCLVKKQFVIGNEALKVFNKVETNLLQERLQNQIGLTLSLLTIKS